MKKEVAISLNRNELVYLAESLHRHTMGVAFPASLNYRSGVRERIQALRSVRRRIERELTVLRALERVDA